MLTRGALAPQTHHPSRKIALDRDHRPIPQPRPLGDRGGLLARSEGAGHITLDMLAVARDVQPRQRRTGAAAQGNLEPHGMGLGASAEAPQKPRPLGGQSAVDLGGIVHDADGP